MKKIPTTEIPKECLFCSRKGNYFDRVFYPDYIPIMLDRFFVNLVIAITKLSLYWWEFCASTVAFSMRGMQEKEITSVKSE